MSFNDNSDIQKPKEAIQIQNDNTEEKDSLDLFFSFLEYYELEEGDTLISTLKKTNLNNIEIDQLIIAAEDSMETNQLRIGTRIEIISELIKEKRIVKEVVIYPDSEEKISVLKIDDKFTVRKDVKTLYSELVFHEVDIDKSIYSSLKNINVPDNIIMSFVQLFSFDIDFQRDIRNKNQIKILFEQFKDKEDKLIKTGSILFAEIVLTKDAYELYKFEDNNEIEYFNSDGKSATKALMKTPINGARLSSAYGMRKHPILGYNKKHMGVDFAAPTGTPIMAAGTGHIEYVGTNGGAGKYIRIKHLNGYKTSYSHLSSYASGMQKNVRVKQGQTIGYVGSTGLSTGPHLHYEVIFNGEKINPMKMKLPSGKKLKGTSLNNFLAEKDRINNEISKIKN
ncbi:M23 family metallopeptidase [Pelagibacterales bacterium SAG-MED32]|nr:M23 family metallopeptidase [Pelagibacterales bacterium SAG-MED32]